MRTYVEQHELVQEHEALEHEVNDWRQWWHELADLGQPRLSEMGDRLAQFRTHLRQHFLHEQRSGVLAEYAHLNCPQGSQIHQLWAEHQMLLRELDGMIDHLSACESNPLCWGDARAGFEAFLDRLQSHDEAERRLLDELN